ncbi:MAG: Ig domain-containing protein [Candidatus Cryptobacteroides sp.]|nr:Ig domain-containing protein [Candidatus Cryptobacteroides sp.]
MELSGNIRFADESSWLTLTTDSDDAATIKIALSYADEGREETEFSVTPSAGMARFPVGEILRTMINGYHKGITCVVTATQGANSCSTGTNRVFPCRTFALANAKSGIFSDKPKSVKAFGGAPDKITVFCDNNATITVYAKAIQKDGTESASFILDSTSSHNGFYAIDVSLDAVTAKMASEGINADFAAYRVWMTGTLGTSDTYLFEVSPSRLSRKTYKFLGRKGTYEYVHATGEFRRSIEAETQSFVNSGIERELANDSTLTFEQNAGHVDSAEMGAYWLELLASKERYFIGNDGSEHLIIVDDFDTSLTDGIVSSLTFKWHYANPYNAVIEKSDVAITGLAVTGISSVNNDSNSAQFNVIYLPSNTTQRGITWSIVSGQQYASIDAGTGLLTVKSGARGNTVKVRATSKANTSIYAEKSVSVTYYAATVAVTGVSLSKTSISLAEGGSETLLATVSPANATNKAVTWSSSNDSVATVDANGKVTAVNAGTATITVRTVDGGKTATCNLTVTAVTVAVTGVSLSKTSLSLAEGGSQTLLATVSPANATNKAVTWSSSNDSVATVDASGKVTAVKAGTATITVRTVDGGKTATCNLSVTAGIIIVDYIQTDGQCIVTLLNAMPAKDMVIASSFYVAQDPEKGNIFYATADGTILMYVHQRAGRRIESWGYANDGVRDISYDIRPSEPTHYLLKQDFTGLRKHTAFYSSSGSPCLHSGLDAYQNSNPSERFAIGYVDQKAFPSDQCLSVFGRHGDEAGSLVAGSRFYGMKIWRNGELVYDLVPAKSGDEYGIYDIISGAFNVNTGTGTLTGGNL